MKGEGRTNRNKHSQATERTGQASVNVRNPPCLQSLINFYQYLVVREGINTIYSGISQQERANHYSREGIPYTPPSQSDPTTNQNPPNHHTPSQTPTLSRLKLLFQPSKATKFCEQFVNYRANPLQKTKFCGIIGILIQASIAFIAMGKIFAHCLLQCLHFFMLKQGKKKERKSMFVLDGL